MNTVKSFWLGWGALVVAGGGAYYYAKKEINADRREKLRQMQQKQYENQMMQYNTPAQGATTNGHSYNPSAEASADPAPTRHAPQTEDERIAEKGKYEATKVYRSPKGDRFS